MFGVEGNQTCIAKPTNLKWTLTSGTPFSSRMWICDNVEESETYLGLSWVLPNSPHSCLDCPRFCRKPEEAGSCSPIPHVYLRITVALSPPHQGLQYMELIPKEKQPVTGTEGAYYRRRQLMHQLPIYDQDPSRCRGLLENELKVMEEFVKQYKSEALGVGEVALPGQGGLPKEEGKQQEKPEVTETTAPTTNGSIGDPSKEYVSLSHASWCGWNHQAQGLQGQGASSRLFPVGHAFFHTFRPPAAIWCFFTLCLALSCRK